MIVLLAVLFCCSVGYAADTDFGGIAIGGSSDPDVTASTNIFTVNDTDDVAKGLAVRGDGTVLLVSGTQVASLHNLDIGAGNMFSVTGVENINNIETADTFTGRFLFLHIQSTPIIGHNVSGGNIRLAGDASVTSVADDVLLLVCLDGTLWFQIGQENTQVAD